MATLVLHHEKCTLCGNCVENCPFGAMEIKDGKVQINASCRMCRLCVKNCPCEAITLEEDQEQPQVDKEQWKGVMVFVEQEASGIHPVAYELLGEAKKLASVISQPVYAVYIGDENADQQAKELLHYGADQVFVYAHPQLKEFRADVYVNILEDCIKQVRPGSVLVGATSLGRSLAPRCATRFRTGLTADCTKLEMKENTDLVQIRPAFGGNIMAQIITTHSRPQFATVRYKVMDAASRTPEEKMMQRVLLQYFKPQNRHLVIKALKAAGREDLIGKGPGCLVSAPYDPNAKYKAQAAQKTTAKGKNGRGRQGNTSQRGNQRREKNRQKRGRG